MNAGRSHWRALLALLVAMAAVFAPAGAAFAQDDGSEPSPIPELDPLTVVSVSRDADTGEVTITSVAPVSLAGRDIPFDAVRVQVGDQQIGAFYSSVPADQLEVMLAIDVSGSMTDGRLDAAKNAAFSFLDLVPDTVAVGLVSFSNEVVVQAPLGSDSATLTNSIASLNIGGDTSLRDAVIISVDQFGPPTASGRRVVVLLTDGVDDGSIAPVENVVAAVAASGADVFAIALGGAEGAAAGLDPLVAGTNGRVELAQDNTALQGVYDELAAELASQFTVRFTPPSDDAGNAVVSLSHLGTTAAAAVEFEAYVPDVVVEEPRPDQVEEPAPVFADATVQTIDSTGWLRSSMARNVGIGALAAVFLLAGLMLSFPSQGMVQLAATGRERADMAQVSALNERLEGMADRALERGGRGRLVANSLERAGIELRPAEFVVISGSIAVTIAMVLWLFGGLIVAIVGLVLSFMLMRLWVSAKAKARHDAFEEQLPSTLQLIGGALRAGQALPQAAETVANEAQSPTSDEFHRLVTETRLGRDFGDSLRAMADRVGSEDFRWVVQAIDIHRDVGGDLSEVLDNVHSTIRDRLFIRRQFKALSAESRYSAYLIVSLPFFVAAAMYFVSPDYITPLFTTGRGLWVLAAAGGLIVLGSLVMRQLMKAKF